MKIGVSNYINTASGGHNQIDIQPIPGAQSISFNHTNHDTNMNEPGLYIGGGYEHRLSNTWSWSLGERLSSDDLNQKVDSIAGDHSLGSYRYTINTRIVNALLRLNWQASLYNVFYVETQAGIVRLISNDFRITSVNRGSTYKKKTINHFSCGASVGWIHLINEYADLVFQ